MRGRGKQQLIVHYGAICMLGGIVSKKNPITFHHINKRSNGGKKSTRNGALVSQKMHTIMNIIEDKDKKFYHQIQYYFRCYKRADKETQQLFRELAYEDVMRRYKVLKKEM